jgi:hypothetical protein
MTERRLSHQLASQGFIKLTQGGFRPLRSAEEQALSIVQAAHESWARKRDHLLVTLDIRKAFDCDGNGGLRAGQPSRWAETTFRLHLYDASGQTVLTLDTTPGWTTPRQGPGAAEGSRRALRASWLADQFPPASRLDPPSPRSHSSP